MALLNNAFTGKMNLDQQEYRVPAGDYVDALNITRDSRGDFKDTVVANIDGNVWVLYSLPLGTNKCIGQYADRLRNRVYMFIWNDANYDTILYYDRNTNTIVKLMENLDDTAGVDVLNFNPSFKINHVDIIYRDDAGDLLLWTDGYNPPREIDVDTINDGTYSYIKKSYIELAKRPGLDTPTCVYGSDTTKNANNLRRALFMFTYRWIYDDYSYSTFSTYSKIPLPVGFYGSDNDIDNTNNNFITVTVPTGDENVAKVEIAVRISEGALWSDFVTAVILDKAALSIPDNDVTQYLFYNDNTYPPIPLAEQGQLFDWVPQTADCQVLANGSTPVYGAILEGYNNIPQNLLDVTITVENVTNTPPDAPSLPSLTYTQIGAATFTFAVGSVVPTGTRYKIYIFFNGNPSLGQTYGVRLVGDYTSLLGDTPADVAAALYSQFNSYPAVPTIAGSYLGGSTWDSNFNFAGAYPQQIQVTPGTPGGSTISTEKTWLWDANYTFGLVYVDEQNRDMPGVTTFTNPTDSDNDFAVTTPSFSEDTGIPQTPVISAAINHLPPEGAVKYYWVRRRATYGDFIQYITCDFQEDTDYYYFCLANIATYHTDNNQFIYSDYTPTSESRIKIIANEASNLYSDVHNEDYLILGTVVRTLTGGSTPDDDKTFLKVKKPTTPPSPAYQQNMLVMVYVPLKNPVTEEGAVFYEWGEAYDIYTGVDGVRYHAGMDQDQTASQPATFTWPEGDVYFHQRTMYNVILASGNFSDTVSVMDQNFSDFFLSGVNDNGRPQVIEANALQTYLPALVRFGQSYQSDTTVNQINRFYFVNFDEYDRSVGSIRKMFIEGRNMFVFQQFDIGVVPVLTQVVKDSANNPLQANSDQLLNKIQYPYIGKYGIGDVPESFAYGKHAKYGIDNNRGVAWRLSNDGLTPLSILYQCNNFFVTKTEKYNDSYNLGFIPNGNPTIYGVYNEYNNHVIWAFEEIDRTYDINSIDATVSDFIGGEKLVTFSGTATLGITMSISMACGDGSNAVVSYITQGGETSGELRDIFIDLINATKPFSAIASSANVLRIAKNFAPFLDISVNVSKVVPDDYYQAPVTITFNESRGPNEGFESFRSDFPEMYGCLNNMLYSFKNGQFWKYETGFHNNFFGQQYDSYIKAAFNGNPGMKKTYQYLTLYANSTWSCPEIKSQLNAFDDTPQESYLVPQDFKLKEGNYNAAFRRALNSVGGIVNGSPLRGNYLIVKFLSEQPSSYVFLNAVAISYIDSPKNPR